MNFYTSISKETTPKNWFQRTIIGIVATIAALFSFNYIIDPYNMTHYNILNIKYKFARDDRTEKVNFFRNLPKFDTIILGSSRVYSINPRTVTSYIGGKTYNFGVGTATIEDHLGILLYLEKHRKLPKNLIIGVDFYTFNPDIPPNSYFLANKDLNFLSYNAKQSTSEYWSKFLSLDATRASIKTLKYHLFKKNHKSRFDHLGWAGRYTKNNFFDPDAQTMDVNNEIHVIRTMMYSNFNYDRLDPKRLEYFERIKQICEKNKIRLYLFSTPLHPLLLMQLKQHTSTNHALEAFTNYFSSQTHFKNFHTDQNFTDHLEYFKGATHTTAEAGDIIIRTLLDGTED